MLLTLLVMTIAMLALLVTVLYLAYRETEADFPQPHRHTIVHR